MLSAGPGAQRAWEGGGASKCWLRMTISIPISGQLLVMSSTKSSSFQALHGKVICEDTGKTYWVRVMNYMFSGWRRASPWGRPTPRPGHIPGLGPADPQYARRQLMILSSVVSNFKIDTFLLPSPGLKPAHTFHSSLQMQEKEEIYQSGARPLNMIWIKTFSSGQFQRG